MKIIFFFCMHWGEVPLVPKKKKNLLPHLDLNCKIVAIASDAMVLFLPIALSTLQLPSSRSVQKG
jgi:hypothetical protein